MAARYSWMSCRASPRRCSPKVLTALEDRKIRRVGGNRQIEVDVRIIAATSRELRAAVESGEFREDLLHRLDLYRLALPPLRERGEDILRLTEQLLAQLCRQHRLPRRQITEQGRQRLLAYRWPGNVRELAHELERGLVFEDEAALDFAHLPGGGRVAPPWRPAIGSTRALCFRSKASFSKTPSIAWCNWRSNNPRPTSRRPPGCWVVRRLQCCRRWQCKWEFHRHGRSVGSLRSAAIAAKRQRWPHANARPAAQQSRP